MANYTLENLINDSMRIYPGMIAVWPRENKEEIINFDVATFNGSYASNNGTLAFVYENILYVTPSTRKAYDVLASFKQSYFYVPFSNGDYPKNERTKWMQLRTMQNDLYKEDFIQDCNKYCEEQNIGSLDNGILARCFVIPETGVKVKHLYFEDTYYPMINSLSFDCTAVDYIGRFCTNNGRVVFVYRDGSTRVTKGYWILDYLISAGYKEGNLFVPFSNGEQILDPCLREKWDAIKK